MADTQLCKNCRTITTCLELGCGQGRATPPSPSTAPEVDERAAFEAWHRSKFATRHSTGQPTRDMHNGIYAEQYGPVHQQQMWEAWQHRAALASHPAEVDDEGKADAKRLDWLESTNQTFCGNYSNTGFRAIGSSIWHGTLREAIDGAMIEAAPSHTTNKENG